MKKSIALLFPGQGSQSIGMGKNLAERYPVAKRVFDQADEALRYPLTQLCWIGPDDRLKMTEITQPAILTASIAALRVLEDHGVIPTHCAGHSLGEYSAHVAAKTMTFADAVRTVRNRGRYMQDAVPAGEGAMAAVLGLKQSEVEEACAQVAAETGEIVSAANINSPEQIVISGSKNAVDAAMPKLKERGAKRVLPLAVSAPFHSALMQPAQERLADDLNALEFKNPAVPVIANVGAAPVTTAARARQTLIQQVTAPVLWVQIIQRLIAEGTEVFIEVGPGKVLTGLLRQIDRAQICLNIEDEASLQKTVEVLATS